MTKTISRFMIGSLVLWFLLMSILSLNFGLIKPTPAAALPPTATPVPGPVVASVFFTDTVNLNRLAGELDIWEVDHKQGFLIAQLWPNQLTDLRQRGYRVAIDLLKTTQLHQPLQTLAGQTTGIPGYPCYRTVEETYADMAQLASDYPDLANWIDIGDSWQKVTLDTGYDLRVLVLTNRNLPDPKPKFFLMGAIHARELTTAELTARFAEYLLANYDIDPDITFLLDHFEIHLLPQANPDGHKQAETGLFWRKNIDNDDGCTTLNSWGVDLNRNSSFKWNQCAGFDCSSGYTCASTYRGPSPTSEPEVQAIETYLASIFPDRRGLADADAAPDETMGLFITLHSYGQWVLFPWGWQNGPAPNNSQLETLGRKFGYYTGYEVCQAGEPNCLYLSDGTTDDWAYGELGLAAYTFELGTSFFESCAYFEETIIPKNFPALLYAFKAARRPYRVPAGPETLQVTLTPTSVVAGLSVTLTVLANDTRYESNGWGDEPVQNIAAVRYTVNVPAWLTGVLSYPLLPLNGSFDAPVETAQALISTVDWQPGRYHLIVESQDTTGSWGTPSTVFLWVEGGISITPTRATQLANPGQRVVYTFQLSNVGSLSDTFEVAVSGNRWPTLAPMKLDLALPASALLPLTITVTVPPTVAPGNLDVATVTFKAQTTNIELPQLVLTTTARGNLFLPLLRK